jgi:hypothetical protein
MNTVTLPRDESGLGDMTRNIWNAMVKVALKGMQSYMAAMVSFEVQKQTVPRH